MKYLLLLTAGIFLSAIAYSQGCTVNYVDPTFQLGKTDPTCHPNSGRIDVVNAQGGVAPYTYRLVETNTTNSTGIFTGLQSGLYTVELKDACGMVRTRQVTLVPYQFSFTYNVKRTSDCNDGDIVIDVTPSDGNYEFAVVNANNDTIWSNRPDFSLQLTKTLKIIVKDECGNVQQQNWTAPEGFLPYIAAIQHNLQCDKFDLFPVYYGFDNPTVCLYQYGTNKLIECKQAPKITNFFDVPWGDYYIIVEDKCFRDSMFKPNMESFGGSQIDPYNWDCNSFTMHVDGMEDTVCLYDAITNKLISCKGQDTVSINPRTGKPWPSGAVWENLPYGSYYAWIYDPCMDSTFRIDSTVTYPFNTFFSSLPGCSLNQTTVQVNFDHGTKKPYTVDVFNFDGSLNSTFTTNLTDNYFGVNVDTNSGPLTVIGYDACGIGDTAVIVPQPTRLNKKISVYNKCPGVSGTGGSGDVKILATTYNSNIIPQPRIIKKNGIDTDISYNFLQNDTFQFVNLESGLYVVKYTFTSCTQLTLYDTIEIKNYIYPAQDTSIVQQCGRNPFTFTVPVRSGLSPYTYQIIGNTPTNPSLISAIQSDSTFTIGTGQAYESIRVRTIDRCGNSAINEVKIVPISSCDFVLPVDTIRKNPALANKSISVYPNPSNKFFSISFNQKKKSNYLINIINASGVKIYEQRVYNIDRKDHLINERLVPGFYIINVIDLVSGQSSVFKQIVQ